MKQVQVYADPHSWPKKGTVSLDKWALVIVDMQNDYCVKGCYMDKAGFDIDTLRQPIQPTKNVLEAAREAGLMVVFTRHGESSMNKNEISASVRGDSCWSIIDELQPLESEMVFDKSTISAFYSSNIDEYLKSKGIEYLAFCGNTIDCCVHSTLRSADDLGYNCLLLSDCCGAVNDGLHSWSIESIKVEGGVFGAVTDSDTFIEAIR